MILVINHQYIDSSDENDLEPPTSTQVVTMRVGLSRLTNQAATSPSSAMLASCCKLRYDLCVCARVCKLSHGGGGGGLGVTVCEVCVCG